MRGNDEATFVFQPGDLVKLLGYDDSTVALGMVVEAEEHPSVSIKLYSIEWFGELLGRFRGEWHACEVAPADDARFDEWRLECMHELGHSFCSYCDDGPGYGQEAADRC